jgi:hypothetical protein
MSQWSREIPVDGSVELPPDPSTLASLGRNHSLETALADLVDNSVDAEATDVLIRFVREGNRLVGLYVVDNGNGIAPETIDIAMTIGGQRRYTGNDLGRFGLGLKAASFSQAGSLTVLSRTSGPRVVGRRWLLDGDRSGFHCDTVPGSFATTELDRAWPVPRREAGTVVRWDRVHGFPAFNNSEHVDEFLSRTISHLQGHLGLMFHRLLAAGRVRILIDVEDTAEGSGVASTVAPLDPFAYPNTLPGWPKDLTATLGATTVALHCHLWPGRSNLPQYRLAGGPEQRQGLYFYRRNRLLHAGGWEGIHAPDKKLQLARVSIDIDDDTHGLFRMNPEKSRVSAGPDFAVLVNAARAADGTTIATYLKVAEATWTTSNQRTTARRAAVFPPGRGLHPAVSREIRDELPQRNDEPLHLLWRSFTGDEFFQIDRSNRTLWLNQAYRRALLGGRRGGLNDLPLVKTLMFLLTEQVFEGAHLGARDKDNIELWQEILTAAAKAERLTFEARA